jgi:hypothetical protein
MFVGVPLENRFAGNLRRDAPSFKGLAVDSSTAAANAACRHGRSV